MAQTDNYLRSSTLENKKLKLFFKYPLGEVKHFTIKSNSITKHVYDIEGAALPKSKNISQYKAWGVKAFRIGQYTPKILRVVIETTHKMKGIVNVKKNELTLFLPSANLALIPKSVKPQVLRKKYAYNPTRRYQTIILDAGHGGRDIGASSKGVREKDLTLSMTLKLKRILEKMGYKVLLTRNKDKFMNLKQRSDYVYQHRGSIFVSIHANAAPRKRTKGVHYEGIEVFYLSLKNSKRIRNKRAMYRGKKVYSRNAYKQMVSSWKFSQSKKLSTSVHKHILSHVANEYKIYDKGIKRKDFWVLLATKMPSILVETGYLTNANEVKKLQNSHYQTLLMEGIAHGINNYYGL